MNIFMQIYAFEIELILLTIVIDYLFLFSGPIGVCGS